MFHLSSFSRTSFSPISWAPADESQVPEEELRPEYRGSGGYAPAPRRQFSDATEQDLLALVQSKWEAIEARQRDTPPVVERQTVDRVPQPAAQPGDGPEAPAFHLTFPFAPHALADVPALTAAVDPQATEARRLRRQRNDEALILMLAELL